MKTIRIDVTKKCVEEIDIDDELETLYESLQCRVITTVYPIDPLITDQIYVDDEALLKDVNDLPGGFFIKMFPSQPLLGHGLVIAIDKNTGERIDCKLTVQEVAEQVTFLTDEEVVHYYNTLNEVPPLYYTF